MTPSPNRHQTVTVSLKRLKTANANVPKIILMTNIHTPFGFLQLAKPTKNKQNSARSQNKKRGV
ncbi:MAG: hypothetical protein SPK22_07945 [Alloprevotella sp.]|nr:hypothetical protein [Alloprevotella sp.]